MTYPYPYQYQAPRPPQHGVLYWLLIGWWWPVLTWAGRVSLWLIFLPLGIWRSVRHSQKKRDYRLHSALAAGQTVVVPPPSLPMHLYPANPATCHHDWSGSEEGGWVCGNCPMTWPPKEPSWSPPVHYQDGKPWHRP